MTIARTAAAAMNVYVNSLPESSQCCSHAPINGRWHTAQFAADWPLVRARSRVPVAIQSHQFVAHDVRRDPGGGEIDRRVYLTRQGEH